MKTASLYGSAGWVGGIVGVHPWQLAFADPKVQDEVLGSDSDTWQASPYMPGGVAVPVDGGYRMTGRWQFSSGTDHCDWIFLGAMIGDNDGKPIMPPVGLHVILPRSDYTIVEDSWDVVGLRGTGSKDIIVKDAFIPDYRVMKAQDVMDGTAAKEYGVTETLYRMPWSTMFPLGITSATIGICEASSPPASITSAPASARAVPPSRTIRTSCTRWVKPPPKSTRPASSCSRTWTASGISSRRARKLTSRPGRLRAGTRSDRRGGQSVPPTRFSTAPAETLCAWITRCSDSGGTRMPACIMLSTSAARPIMRPPWLRSESRYRTVLCA